jgi:hydroxymethylglutaryl-CoA lyase
MPTYPREVRIVEVGPRDGLQNEAAQVPTAAKVIFIKSLAAAGLKWVEAGSFVHPKLVPQLADADEVFRAIGNAGPTVYSSLVPNERGLERAIAAGVRRIAVFTAASETFTQKNIGMSIAESLEVFGTVLSRARAENVSARGYLSTAFDCPYEGRMSPQYVANIAARLLDLGVDEVAISDTIGSAVPTDIQETVGAVLKSTSREKVALHLHDTHGTALANVLAGLELGISTFDSAAGGLGGCPFAPGASGNLATEDLIYMLDGMGIRTGVDATRVTEAADQMGSILGKPLSSAAWRRMRSSSRAGGSCRRQD